MINLDLEDVLGITLPYQVHSFSILRIERFNEHGWQFYFADPRIIRTKPSGAKDIPEFRLRILWGVAKDLQRYSLCFSGRRETLIPVRARAWLEQQAAKLDEGNCLSGVRDRITVEDREKYLDVVTCVSNEMTAESARLLASKNEVRLEKFRLRFDAAFTQVALDAIHFIDIDQRYRDNVRRLAS